MKNACFLWKIIWFLFHSIAEGLPLIMKNNIIDMTSTARFAGPYIFHEIFHYISAHLGLYFVDNSTNLFFGFLTWLRSISINLIFHLHVLNRMISTANCNRRFEKSLGLETFYAKDRWWCRVLYGVCSGKIGPTFISPHHSVRATSTGHERQQWNLTNLSTVGLLL